jgi:HlyD family secretion protein
MKEEPKIKPAGLLKRFFKHKIIRKVLVGGLILAGAFGGYKYYQSRQEADVISKYQVAQVSTGSIEVAITGSGQIYAESQVDLKANMAGDGLEVTEVNASNNEYVEEGQTIVVLDSSDVQEKIQEAALSLETAEKQYKITADENDKQTVDDKRQRQLQEIAVAQKQLALQEAYEDLEDYTITAPIDGVLTSFELEPGDSVSSEDTIGSVVTEEKYALISLNEVDAAQVESGATVELTFDALEDITVSGEVETVESIGEVDSGVVSYDVKIKLNEQPEKLKIGMSVNAEIVIDSVTDVLTVSNTALQSTPDGSAMVLVATPANGESFDDLGQEARGDMKIIDQEEVTVKPTQVETGITDDATTEITSGLEEGQIIVVQELSTTSSANGGSGNGSTDSGDDDDDEGGGSIMNMGGGGPNGGGGPPGR